MRNQTKQMNQLKAEYDSIESIIDELGSESNYDIPSTENVEVHNTEWVDTETC